MHSKRDRQWAKNFIRSMNEKYGRHNSSQDFRCNPFGNPPVEFNCDMDISFDRVIGELHILCSKPEDCQIGDAVRLEAIKAQSTRVWIRKVDGLCEISEMLFERVRMLVNGEKEESFWKRIE